MSSAVQFEIRKASGAQPYYWRVIATGNSKVLCSSETYYNKQDAINAASLVRSQGGNSDFYDYTT